MRTRAGIVLIENDMVALIRRHRAGLEYYVFPGGGMEEGETPEQAAVREALEELGIEVAIQQKVAIIYFDQSMQIYYLVKRVGGRFGTGTGEEFTDADPNDPTEGIYIPVWMPVDELSHHADVHPAEIAKLVLKTRTGGWPKEPIEFVERSS